MTIYDLLYVMDNMNFNIVVENDALINEDAMHCAFEGEVSEFKETDLFYDIQDEEVTDLYTLADGRIVICYNREEE